MKLNYLKNAFVGIFGLVLFSSCSSTKMLYTNIDVLRPAKVSFATDANNLLIVNNTVVQPSHLGHSTRLLNENEQNVDIATDSLSMLLVSALSEEIEKKDFFLNTNLMYETVNTSSDFNVANLLRSYQVSNLSTQHQADVILSLNKLKVIDLMEEYFLTDTRLYFLALDAVYESHWSIQYPNRSQTDTIVYTDTVHWNASSYSRRRLFADFPKRSDALMNGALYVGRKSVNRFIPYWEEQERFFFDSKNKMMQQGMNLVYERDWKGAIKAWEEALSANNNKDKKLQVHASNNLAVAYEITGELGKAIGYMSAAIEVYSKTASSNDSSLQIMSDYYNDLIRRKNDAALLEEQLGK